jgi:hypothetical protein
MIFYNNNYAIDYTSYVKSFNHTCYYFLDSVGVYSSEGSLGIGYPSEGRGLK